MATRPFVNTPFAHRQSDDRMIPRACDAIVPPMTGVLRLAALGRWNIAVEVAMATRTLTVELPEEIVELAGSDDVATTRARTAFVLDLLREGTISQGQAAQALDLTRWDILDLMGRYRIPSGPESEEEVRRDVETALRFVGRQGR